MEKEAALPGKVTEQWGCWAVVQLRCWGVAST